MKHKLRKLDKLLRAVNVLSKRQYKINLIQSSYNYKSVYELWIIAARRLSAKTKLPIKTLSDKKWIKVSVNKRIVYKKADVVTVSIMVIK